MRRARATQAGFIVLIGAVFLLSVLALVIAFAAAMTAADVRGSEMLDEDIEALVIAESGLENALGRLSDASAVCDATLALTRPLGRGSFAIGNGLTTDFTGAALPADQCRVQVTGRIPIGNGARTIEGIAAIGGGGIGFDGASNGSSNSSPFGWNHTVGAGTNRLLVVGVSLRNSSAQTVTAATFNGVALTPLVQRSNGTDARVEIWYLANPAVGTFPIQITYNNGNTRVVGGAVSLTGVQTANPFDGTATNIGNSTAAGAVTATVTTTVANAWVVDAVSSRTTLTMTAAPSRAERWNVTTSGGDPVRISGAGSTRGPIAVPAAVTMNWTASAMGNPAWAIVVAGIRPAANSTLLSWRDIAVP